MDIVKKNLVSIICGVIALVAVIATFYPMGGKFEDLNKKLSERAAKFSAAETIVKKQRSMPEIDLVSNAEPTPLKVFPSPKITAMAKGYLDQLIAQSRGVLQEAVKINKRECSVGPNGAVLLTANSLPEPKNNADNIFKQQLQPEYEFVRSNILGAGFPPTAEEIKKEDDKLLAEHQKKRILGADGQALNEEAIQKAYQADSLALPEKMRTEVASKCRIYLDPAVLSAPKEIVTAPQSPSPAYIWYAQAALWVQEDVCRALSDANKSSKNVMEAPIKRIMSFDIPFGPSMYVRAAAAGGDGSPVPMTGGRNMGNAGYADAGTPNNAEPKRAFAVSPTGRTCNSMYDVISFSLVLHVDQRKIPAILKSLSMDRYITVTDVSLTRLDTAALKDQGFVYGPAPIAEMTLKGEALQMREWTVPWMPAAIKDSLVGPGVEYQFQLAEKKPG